MLKHYLKCIFLFTVPFCAHHGFSQDLPSSAGESAIFEDELLDNLVGIWKLTGVVAGDRVENTFEAKWVLNHQFLQLHYKDTQIPSQYEALVYIGFNHKENRYVAHWLDVFGGYYSETLGYGKRGNNSIQFVFNSPDGKLHNTYKWFPDQQKWASIIEQQGQDGKWQTFAIQEIQKNIEEDDLTASCDGKLLKLNQQSPEKNIIIEKLNKHIIPLRNPPLLLSDAELGFLDKIANAKITGMGEATHGTKEFFQMKHRMFKYLVENHHFKVFGFETPFADSLLIDRYVTHGEGDIDSLMRNHLIGFWVCDEVKALLNWMRRYNQDKAETDKIHFIGFDSQYISKQPEMIIDLIKRNIPELEDKIPSIIYEFKELADESIAKLNNMYFKNMEMNEKQAIVERLASFIELLEENKEAMIMKSSETEYQITRQLARSLQQACDELYFSSRGFSPSFREKFMGENAIWLSNLYGENCKIVLWAHNDHVADMTHFYTNIKKMGKFIKDEIKDRYKVIGFGFSKGSFTANEIIDGKFFFMRKLTLDTEPIEDSINAVLSKLLYKNFILELDLVKENETLAPWFLKGEKFLSIGANFNRNLKWHYPKRILPEIFDVLIYFNSTHASDVFDVK